MGVTLKVISANAHKLGGQSEVAFPSAGTIGRSQDNSLVLPDPEKYISGKHARIEERGDGCYLTDLSVNGTYVNGADQPIGHGNSQRLEDGDRFRIGEYEFQAVLQAEHAQTSQSSQWPPPGGGDPLGGSDPFGSPDPFGAQNPIPGGGFDPLREQEKDPLNLISGQPDPLRPAPSPAPAPGAGNENAAYNIGDVGNFTPPQAAPDPLAPSPGPFQSPGSDPFGEPDPFGAPPGGKSVDPLAPGSGLGGGAGGGGGAAIPDDWDKTTLPGMPDSPAEPPAGPTQGGEAWPQSPAGGYPPAGAGTPGAPPGPGQGSDPFGQPSGQSPFPPPGPQGVPGAPPNAGQPMPGAGYPGQLPGQPPGQMPGQPPGQMPGQPPGQMPGQPQGQMPGQPQGQMPGQPSGQIPGQPPGQIPGQPPGQIPGQPPQQPPPGMQPPQPGMPGAQPAPGGSAGLAALLEAAGFDPATAAALDNPATAQAIGQSMRIVVQQMMEVLRARANLKNEFRVPMTQIAPTTNNPLKFCANDVDALTRLLIQDRRGFMGMVEAIAEGFEDIKNHQLSMMAGMQAAYGNLLSSFNPARLQENFDPKLGRGDMLRKHGKYWDMFEDLYRDLARDSDNTFARLFGDEFARAYEEQMDILSRNRRR